MSSPGSGDAVTAREPCNQPVAITWIGHATTLIELDQTRLLTDPVLGKRIGPLIRIAEPVRLAELGRIDCVLLSHLHADHAELRSLRSVAGGATVLAPRGAGDWLRAGVSDVRGLDPGEATRSAGERPRDAGRPRLTTPAAGTTRGPGWLLGARLAIGVLRRRH